MSKTDIDKLFTSTNRPTVPREVFEAMRDPEQLSTSERKAAIVEARRLAHAGGRKKVVEGPGGEYYWAKEYPDIFTFDGELRGKFENVDPDPAKRPADQQLGAIGGLGGDHSHVIIKMDNGAQVIIRKTSDPSIVSAAEQEFDMLSTTMVEKSKGDNPRQTWKLSTEMLKDVIVIPGYPLIFSPREGEPMRFRVDGKVESITALELTEDGKVQHGHPWLNKPERISTARQEFNDAVRAAERRRSIAAHAIRQSTQP